MKVVKATYGDIERLRPVASQWQESCNGNAMKIELDIEAHLADLAALVERDDADLFILLNDKNSPPQLSCPPPCFLAKARTGGAGESKSGGKPVGYMGVTCFKSPLGNQLIANEHFWYVLTEFRGYSTLLLIKKAHEWAKAKGCSHLILNASCLAGPEYPRVCMLCERLNFQEFEKSYIVFLR